MSTLNKKEILNRLKEKNDAVKLIVTPILDRINQIGASGVDLRLSNQFIVFNPEHIPYFNIGNQKNSASLKINMQIRKYQNHVIVPFHQSFILHPKTVVLGSTLEYISMPLDIEGTLEGRSSWARLGLIIATACAIDPGYKGCITLELTNLGNIPIKLYPGIRIAKLILRETSSLSENYDNKRKYYCQIGPEFSKIHLDEELEIFSSE
ncbi:MAG TPA: dCTP deaminase [Candidatus Atribacteria bacterium]|nr:dCTP deaminase [Candidatus Atribacteria bacterium]